jgi:hypothetical protein
MFLEGRSIMPTKAKYLVPRLVWWIAFILPAGAARSQTPALTGIIVSGAVQLTVDLQRYSSMDLL